MVDVTGWGRRPPGWGACLSIINIRRGDMSCYFRVPFGSMCIGGGWSQLRCRPIPYVLKWAKDGCRRRRRGLPEIQHTRMGSVSSGRGVLEGIPAVWNVEGTSYASCAVGVQADAGRIMW